MDSYPNLADEIEDEDEDELEYDYETGKPGRVWQTLNLLFSVLSIMNGARSQQFFFTKSPEIIHLKLLISGFLLILSIAAVQAQNATTNAILSAPLGGYLVVFPQTPLTTIRFDGNSEDIAKIISVPHAGTSFNHDGTAFKAYVRPTSSESYNANLVDYAQRDKDVSEYQKNVQSGKWTRFVNGD